MNIEDTIVAISSAVGPAARMIVRLSGPKAIDLLSQICGQAPTEPRAYRTPVRMPPSLAFSQDRPSIPAWIYVFRAPKSYTAQDLVELHLPGNPLLVRLIVEDLVRRGARHAEPGEFTSRAYLNGRLDLTEAEGVAMTISAGNDAELQAARQLLSGELARRLKPIMEQLAHGLALLEAGIDFVEEDISFISAAQLRARLDGIEQGINDLLRNTARIERLSHEPRFALVGRPNAGKSTLLNALARHDRAVVSPVAGTTRDALSVRIALDRGMVTIIDVAGLEAVGYDPHGIHAQMQDRARRTIEEADFVIQVLDASEDDAPLDLSRAPDLIVRNKSDLASKPRSPGGVPTIDLSALYRTNLDVLERKLSDLAYGLRDSGATLALGARHLQALDDSLASLTHARSSIDTGAAELIAHDLREALDALGRILGQVTPDDVLGRIFSSFCIGK